MNKIKKGDEVIAITGKDKGKRGLVLSVLKKGKLLIEGINLVKKHVKPDPNAQKKGGIVLKSMPIDRSNVMVYDPVAKKGTRIEIRILQDSKRARFGKASGQPIDIKTVG